MQQTISFTQGQEIDQEIKIVEFLESNCEMMDGKDLQFYADETGKGLKWVIENGKDINPVIKQVFHQGNEVDSVWSYPSPI